MLAGLRDMVLPSLADIPLVLVPCTNPKMPSSEDKTCNLLGMDVPGAKLLLEVYSARCQ